MACRRLSSVWTVRSFSGLGESTIAGGLSHHSMYITDSAIEEKASHGI